MRNYPAESPAPRRRWPLLILPLLLCLVESSPSAANPSARRDEETTRVVKVTTQTQIRVENTRGRTVIVGRKDVDDVRIRILKVVRARDDKTAGRWMDELRYSIEEDSGRISVVTRHPEQTGEQRSLWNLLTRIKDKAYIDYTIEVPSSFEAKVSTTSGDVKISWLEGGVKLFGSSGDVFFKGIGGGVFAELSSGRVEAAELGGDLYVRMSSGGAVARDVAGIVSIQGTSGDVDLDGIGGDVDIELSSGDILLGMCRGNVSALTHNGDISIGDAAGSVTATATSGDIDAILTPLGRRDYAFETSSGDVDLGFHAPEGYGFVLEVNTGSGAIEGNLDIQLDVISRRTLRGVVGTGESRLRVETASGDIRINQIGK